MKRLVAVFTVLALVLIAGTSSAFDLKSKAFLWRTSLAAVEGGYADSMYASTKSAAGYLADTSQVINLQNFAFPQLGAFDTGADSARVFSLWLVNEDTDFASGDTLYIQVDVSVDGKSWVQTAEVYPLVRLGNKTLRTMCRNWNAALSGPVGTAAVNILSNAQCIRVRMQQDNSNTTAYRIRGWLTAWGDDGEELF